MIGFFVETAELDDPGPSRDRDPLGVIGGEGRKIARALDL